MVAFADDLLVEEGRDEAVAEEFGEALEGLDGDLMKATFAVVETSGRQDMKVRMEYEIVAEGLDGGDGGELAVGKVEAGAEPVAQALDGGCGRGGGDAACERCRAGDAAW